jgi:phage shock protein PspC (stress-responsive transcriptional regulator)
MHWLVLLTLLFDMYYFVLNVIIYIIAWYMVIKYLGTYLCVYGEGERA